MIGDLFSVPCRANVCTHEHVHTKLLRLFASRANASPVATPSAHPHGPSRCIRGVNRNRMWCNVV